jgi:hypothetical protein
MGIVRSSFRFSNPVLTDLQPSQSVDVNPASPNVPQSMAK